MQENIDKIHIDEQSDLKNNLSYFSQDLRKWYKRKVDPDNIDVVVLGMKQKADAISKKEK